MTRSSLIGRRTGMVWSSQPPGFVEAAALRQAEGLGHGRIDVEALAASLGIEVVFAPSKDAPIEGMYVRRAGRAFILVNSERATTRQRFTLAHELGHHVFARATPEVEVVDLDYTREKTGEERQVNLFASALLMDARGVSELVAGLALPEAITAVVKTYEVSVEAATIRLSELGLADGGSVRDFLEGLRDRSVRSDFMRRNGINLDLNAGRHRVRLPAAFKERARRLFEAEYLSSARLHDLLDRPKPAAGP